MIKFILYIFIFPFSIWAMDGLNINTLFKQGKVLQARIMYLLISMCISYLVVNFLYDFFINVRIM